MQQASGTPPPTPRASAPAPAPQPHIVQLPAAGVPQTRAELDALVRKRSELSDQLQSAASRRRSLADQLKSADPAAKPGLEARLKVLDDRIVRLEQEIDRTGEQLANAPVTLMTSTTTLPPDIADDIVPIVSIVSVFVLAPLAIAMARLIWKRATGPAVRPAISDHAMQRLDQLQQAVDTIAIEVERISEGQRFVTRLLNEKDRHALGAGSAEPIVQKKSVGAPITDV